MDKLKLLAIDDEIDFLHYLENVLYEYDRPVDLHLMTDPDKAITICKTLEFDIISTDVKMPNVDFGSYLVKLRRSKVNSMTPIVILSANITQDLHEASESMESVYLLEKPLSKVKLYEILNKVSS